MVNRRVVITALSALLTIQAQDTSRKVFEAVAIKPNTNGKTDSSNGSPGRLNASFTVRTLIKHAFGVPETQVVGGPAWIGSESWDIAASTGDNASPQYMEPYLQSLLADRFGFRYHRETREIPIYSLVVAKNGPKMKVHTEGGGSGMDGTGENGRSHLTARNQTMTRFLTYINRNADRPVVDNTGLSDRIRFHFGLGTRCVARFSLSFAIRGPSGPTRTEGGSEQRACLNLS